MNESSFYLFGKWQNISTPLSPEAVNEICAQAQSAKRIFGQYPQDKVLALLERVGKLWADPQFPARQEAEKILPQLTGFSPQMIQLGLAELEFLLNPEVLTKKVKTELRSGTLNCEPLRFDENSGTSLCWQPLGVLLHILSGNVFLVGVGSLIEGLLTNNVSILKMPSEETYFLPIFLKTLIDCDHEGIISQSIALIHYSSDNRAAIEAFKPLVDGIVIWGGESAVQSYRSGLTSHTPLIAFGPKLSFAIVTAQGVVELGLNRCADDLALQVALWDQNACTAPQLCFVEGEGLARQFSSALAAALTKQEKLLPAGDIDSSTACEIQKIRSLYEIVDAKSVGLLYTSSRENLNWTVFLDFQKEIEPSPLHRTLRIISYNDFSEIELQVAKLKSYIQTVGFAGSAQEQLWAANSLGAVGVLRIVDVPHMAGGEIDDPHDGQYDLSQLMRLVAVRLPTNNRGHHPMDLLSPSKQREISDSLLRKSLRVAAADPFYSEQGLLIPKVKGVGDLPKLPILSRARMEGYVASWGSNDSHRLRLGGYLTRSGGSTGTPKFSLFNKSDWNAMIDNATRVFRAAGLASGDRLGNFLMAGDLYGSFISFNHVNYRMGVTNFCFAGKYDAETFIDLWRRFQINAVQGIPTTLMPFLKEVKKQANDFTLEKVMYAGQPMALHDRQWLKEALGVRRVSSIIGTTEAGQIGYQCEHQENQAHHLIDDYNYLEIVDEKGIPVEPGEEGRILVTTLTKSSFPLIRYDIGDSGRLHLTACPCGRPGRVIDYLGRIDDIISLGLVNISYRDLRERLIDLNISELQLVGRFESGREKLLINIESDEIETENLKTEIKKRLETLPDFGPCLKEDFFDLAIHIASPGTFPRRERTGKLPQILDERVSR